MLNQNVRYPLSIHFLGTIFRQVFHNCVAAAAEEAEVNFNTNIIININRKHMLSGLKVSSQVQKAIPEYPFLKVLTGSNTSKVHRTLDRSRRGGYCIAEPTEKCSVDCSCQSGLTKHSHSYSGGTCYTCSSCSYGSSKCCNSKCIDSDYIQDSGKFANVEAVY